MIDWKKLTCPIPSACIIREAYGKVMRGNNNCVPVFTKLNMKFDFIERGIIYFLEFIV